jgi:hypothetical protein
MPQEYLVKGIAIRTKFEYVRDHHGVAADESFRAAFTHHKGLMPLLDSSWYPFAVYDEVIRAIAAKFFSGQLAGLREVGAASAEKALTTVYKSFARSGDVAGFFERIGSLYSTYYNVGLMKAQMSAAGSGCTLLLSGAPQYSPADLEVSAGFFLGACKLLGKPQARCSIHSAKEGVHYDLKW